MRLQPVWFQFDDRSSFLLKVIKPDTQAFTDTVFFVANGNGGSGARGKLVRDEIAFLDKHLSLLLPPSGLPCQERVHP